MVNSVLEQLREILSGQTAEPGESPTATGQEQQAPGTSAGNSARSDAGIDPEEVVSAFASGRIGSESRPVRLLHVEDDPLYARLIETTLSRLMPVNYTVDHVSTLAEAQQRLTTSTFDSILLDLSLPDAEGTAAVAAVRRCTPQAPIVVVTADGSDEATERAIEEGAQDVLVKTRLDAAVLVRTLLLCLDRRSEGRGTEPIRQFASRSYAASVAQMERGAGTVEARRHERAMLQRPVVVIPIRAGGRPDREMSIHGTTRDLSQSGIGFELTGREALTATAAVVGVQDAEGVLRVATADIRHTEKKGAVLSVGAEFREDGDELLSEENLTPRIDPKTFRFQSKLSDSVISEWMALGIVQPVFLDIVLLCPTCEALPTFRNGCRNCGSSRVISSQLIHHFACAHVGYISDFEDRGRIRCPKCRVSDLLAGTDFEYLTGTYRCLDCNWSAADLEVVCQCLACHLRFPGHQAHQKELVGYHVDRLDPLAFLGSP